MTLLSYISCGFIGCVSLLGGVLSPQEGVASSSSSSPASKFPPSSLASQVLSQQGLKKEGAVISPPKKTFPPVSVHRPLPIPRTSPSLPASAPSPIQIPKAGPSPQTTPLSPSHKVPSPTPVPARRPLPIPRTSPSLSSPTPTPTVGSPQKNTPLFYNKVPRPEFDALNVQKTLEGALASDPSMEARRLQAAEGRQKKVLGQKIQEGSKEIVSTLSPLTQAVKEPVAFGAVSTVLSSLEWIGKGVGTILMTLGHHQERRQRILSTNEALVEAAQQSFEKMNQLSKQIDAVLHPSPLQVGKKLIEKTIDFYGKIKAVHQDIYLGEKSFDLDPRTWKKTVEKLLFAKVTESSDTKKMVLLANLQSQLKIEEETFEDYIRLLQIRLLEDSLKDIEMALNKEIKIKMLTDKITVLKAALKNSDEEASKYPSSAWEISKLSFKVQNKRAEALQTRETMKTEIGNLEKERLYYATLSLSPEEKIDLETKRSELRTEAKNLCKFTKLASCGEHVKEEALKNLTEPSDSQIEQLKKDVELLRVDVKNLRELLENGS